ncbi:MAG: sigma 54-interacting transcriptional regulator [Myxococcales bacterium]
MAGEPLLAGRYRFERELGRGAAGRVVLARDVAEGDAPRAIKLVAAPEAARLRWELGVLTRLSHPALPRVFELLQVEGPVGGFDVPPGGAALVSELAEGRPAGELAAAALRDDSARVDLTLRVGAGAATALWALHRAGLAHGDVKPDNLVVSESGEGVKLVDFGLATEAAAGRRAVAAGTPGFMAPEAYRGERGPEADVFALGMTLRALLMGRPAPASGTRSVRELLQQALSPPSEREPLPEATPRALSRLVEAMLEPDPTLRPAAGEVAARLTAMAQERGLSFAAGSVGGGADDSPTATERARAVEALPLSGQADALERLGELLLEPGAVAVAGPAGAGRTRLSREGVLRLQLARARADRRPPTYRRVTRLPEGPLGVDTILHLTAADAPDPSQLEAVQQAAAVEGVALWLVVEAPVSPLPPERTVELSPLPEGAVRKLLERALPGVRVTPRLLREAMEVSGGLAGRLCRLLSTCLGAGDDPAQAGALRQHAGAAEQELSGLTVEAARLSELLSLHGEGLTRAQVSGLLPDAEAAAGAAALLSAGVASSRGEALALRSDVRSAVLDALPAARLTELAHGLGQDALDARARVSLAAAEGDVARGRALAADELERLRRAGQQARRLSLAVAARALLGDDEDDGSLLSQADALRALGRYPEALSLLEGERTPEALALRAELHRLAGRAEQADADARAAKDSPAAAAVRARLAFDRGELQAARELARVAAEAPVAEVALRGTELLALCALYGGEGDAAAALLREGCERAARHGERAAEARLRSLQAQVARADGDVHGAARLFARAFELADAAGERHAAASFLHNVGAQRLDCGEPGPAIAALREAARRLSRLGREADVGRVLYNLAYAAHLIGSGELAADTLPRARAASGAAGDAVGLAYLDCLGAELALTRGDRKAAARALAKLPGPDALPPAVAATCAGRAAAVEVGLGKAAAARRRLEASAGALAAADSRPAELEQALARAMFELAQGRTGEGLSAATAALALAEHEGTFDGRLRALLLAARAARAAGEPARAGEHLSRVRGLLDEAARSLDAADRARLRAVDAYRAAFEAVPRAGEPAQGSAGGAGVDGRWQELAGTAKRLGAERRPGRIHEIVLDAALELSGAECGYLVLRAPDGRPRVRAGRGLSREALRGPEMALSRSIVSRVLGSGRPLSTVDAAADERLSGVASVHALSLRSVLAVPLRIRGEVRGAIYLEDRLRPFAFGELELSLVGDLSDLAGIALDSAESLRAERRAARRLSVARKRLARRVEAQAVELESLKRVQGEQDEGLQGIVGESAAMQRVLGMVRKVGPATVPVLIRGESGTGKELIARALHARSDRVRGPFVGENCGAIPEPLLESTLFGHVRGAFTGADRRRQGLFEVADGGTLFLDEIAEMSPAMQTRLLRVLQDGEVRPVGAESSRTVDVRVIAATHRDLEAMVRAGEFREDLYYRLAVVVLELPPLRERPGDVEALARHLLDKHGEGRAVELSPRALAALRAHPWPGNVRQLENELRRALVMAEGRIELEHLSAALQDGDAGEGDSLDLKAQVDRLERRLIREALDAASGNQTRAARMLGVSRYGLQKMIRRLEVDPRRGRPD